MRSFSALLDEFSPQNVLSLSHIPIQKADQKKKIVYWELISMDGLVFLSEEDPPLFNLTLTVMN